MNVFRSVLLTFLVICFLLQVRNFNRYRVDHRRKHDEAVTYLQSDVCVDSVTRAQLGTFNLCEKASHIVDENPSSAAFYDILNDWYPCGHGRCDAVRDWVHANVYILVIAAGLLGYLVYIKYMDYRKMELFARMTLPRDLALASVQHVD